MIFHHNFSPEIFSVGFLTLRWYGLLYVTGLAIAYLLAEKELIRQGLLKKGEEGKPLMMILLGVIAGARLGYCLFYNFSYYLNHPIEIFYIWEGGLSFHGGFIGVILAVWYLGGRTMDGMYGWGDIFARFTPIGLGFGRLGNFMNSELVGRSTHGNWGVVFDRVDGAARHPSQLYEFFLEGVLLFFILSLIHRLTKKRGVIFWSFIGFYGVFRFFAELVRQPDPQLGFVVGPFTMGQLLSIPMIILALGMALFQALRPRSK